VQIVPVAINYERILEINNLCTELISSSKKKMSSIELLNLIRKQRPGNLGRIFCNFSTPVSLNDYLKSLNVVSLNPNNINAVGLNLTQHLYG
jgi:glycerol-3-phosphate O-acyltransferase